MKDIKISFWTKKLDDIHIEVHPREPGEPAGLCGKPLLGNDYYKGEFYKTIDENRNVHRRVCLKCALELQKVINSGE